MKILNALVWALLISFTLSGGEAFAQKRIALVIGNSAYANVKPLANPSNDATAIAAMFKSAGFDVVRASNDLSGTEMRRAFRDFAEQSSKADIAVVFYAGHGIEVDGTNYLLPVDTILKRDLDVEDEAISLDRIVRMLEPAKRLRLIILDACRDNPFIRTVRRTSETRSLGRGLAKIEPPSSDTLIAFAARAGSTAADGDGAHSPFTAALLKNLTTPGLDLRIALGRVRDDVLSSTSRKQEPFVYGSLGGTTVSLVPEAKPAATVAVPAVPPTPPSDPNASARRDYELAAQVNTKEAWDAFLALNGTGFYADLARAQRAKLEGGQVAMRAPAGNTTPAPATSPAPPAANPPAAVATLTPTAAPEPAKPKVDLAETTKLMHAELARLGCYPGDVDARWGTGSRRALELFNKHAEQKLDTRVASLDALDVLRAKPGRVCPLECKWGYRTDGEACVKIVCETGTVLGEKGQCEKPKAKTASRPDPASSPRAAKKTPGGASGGGGGTQQIVCGDTGCFNVGRGCRSEMRPRGNGGVVAVVICDKQ